jgi:hypothetical protein
LNTSPSHTTTPQPPHPNLNPCCARVRLVVSLKGSWWWDRKGKGRETKGSRSKSFHGAHPLSSSLYKATHHQPYLEYTTPTLHHHIDEWMDGWMRLMMMRIHTQSYVNHTITKTWVKKNIHDTQPWSPSLCKDAHHPPHLWNFSDDDFIGADLGEMGYSRRL